jgi:hypothetical protein
VFLGITQYTGRLALLDGTVKTFEFSDNIKVFCLPLSAENQWIDNEPSTQILGNTVYTGRRAIAQLTPYQTQIILSKERDKESISYIRVIGCSNL